MLKIGKNISYTSESGHKYFSFTFKPAGMNMASITKALNAKG